jgi:hypothetical protein
VPTRLTLIMYSNRKLLFAAVYLAIVAVLPTFGIRAGVIKTGVTTPPGFTRSNMKGSVSA